MPRRLLLALVAGVALSLAFEPATLPWVIPFAIAARLVSLRGLSPRAALAPGAAFGVAFYFTHIWWMHAVGIGAWLALSAAIAVFLTALSAIDAVLLRLRAWPLWTALSWVAIEWARSTWPFGGMPWGRLAFAVIDTPLAPALPYLGTAGVGFVLALLGALVALVAVDAAARRRAAATLVLLCVLLVLPVWRPWHGRVMGHVDVAAVQGNVPGDGDVLDNFRAITASHVALSEQLARSVASGKEPKPAFVLWPENSTATDPLTDAQTNSGIWQAVRSLQVPIVVGGLPDAPDRTHVLNQGIVWDPVTGPGDRYTKHHPVPFGEYLPMRGLIGRHNFGGLRDFSYDMVAGTRRTPLRVAGIPVADAICFDIAYDDVVDAQVRNGGRLLTVQTSNASFMGTAQIAQQFAITRVQAVTTGRYAVVASLNGVSGVIAPDGRVVATLPTRTAAVLDRDVALLGGTTPAVRLGTVPGQAAAWVVLARLALVPIAGRRRRSPHARIRWGGLR
ncbi:apolipoprotein N-acyltransferase [Nocardioides sp. BP30]|uniref:apolipoprotein N-acyltransferase n=1 Tax=Nocardioides sp. BP30 TaxID=3036374 RepID=UPI002468ED0F|nr:apolipoprotein N-acyltransferase [Nocardioides sp. BP30]WGL50760.1 apolipoprotein N-acyltransferase [Nocardioides sp. BP30]